MIPIEHAHTLGTTVLITMGLLGGYVLLLRIREYYRESPDPKLTYTLKSDYERLRQSIKDDLRHTDKKIKQIETYHKSDYERLNELLTHHHGEVSALNNQNTHCLQRLNELSTKLDRHIERSINPS
jgi:chaperonin cofactor prefoldin